MTYEQKLKCMAIVHYEHFDRSLRKVASLYGISKSVLSKWVRDVAAKVENRGKVSRRSKFDGLTDPIDAFLKSNPFASASEVRDHLSSSRDMMPSLSTVYRLIHRKSYTLKVSQRCPPKGPPADHPFTRTSGADPYGPNAISVDECHFCTSDQRRRGWAPQGERVPKRPPCGRTSLTLLLAVDRSGVVAHRLSRASIKGADFASFLQTLPSGKSVILDNAAIHRSACVREAAQKKDLDMRFIPPYSPWFNPIETCFAQIKRRTRRIMVLERRSQLEEVVRKSLHMPLRHDNHFDHCSYLLDRLKRAGAPSPSSFGE